MLVRTDRDPFTLDHFMRSLVDFFNHGILPFTGRAAELERLVRFWRETAEAPGLRVTLLLGEAGMGKSRLIEELVPKALAGAGVVAHAKLYPESATSIAPMVARALWSSAAGRQLLKQEPAGELGAVSSALQRLSRLRPTLLIVEDIHLLAGEALRDFSLLLEGLAYEPISVICVARPVELGARGVLERYLVEEIDLGRLDMVALGEIWRALFQSEPDEEILDLLLKATQGNALALRSALRGVLKSGALAQDPATGLWRATTPLSRFDEALRRNVRLLSEGMAAHLTDEERTAAEQFAALGEVFSREAARAMVPEADRMVEALTFKGIVADIPVPTTMMAGASSAAPMLVFTHTLLHLHLVQRAAISPDAILRVVADDLPLSSVLPFQLLAERSALLTSPMEMIGRAVDRSLRVAQALDETVDWQLGVEVLRMVEKIVEARELEWTPDERHALEIRMLDCRLSLLRRQDHTDEYQGWVGRFMELTAGDPPEALLEYRLRALRHHYMARRRGDVDVCRSIWEEVDRLVEEHPGLRFTRGYILFIQSGATAIGLQNDSELVRQAESRLNALLAAPGITGELRAFAMREVAPQFLWLFGTPEELQTRFALLAEIEKMAGKDDWVLHTRKISFLEGLGHAEEAIRMIDDVVPRLRDKGLIRHALQSELVRIYAEAWFDVPLAELEAHLRGLAAQAPEEIRGALRERAGVRLARIGVLRGDPVWARHIIDTYIPRVASDLMSGEELVILAAAEGDLEERLRALLAADRLAEGFLPLARMVLGEPVDPEEAREKLAGALPDSILTRNDLSEIYAAATMVTHLATAGGHPAALVDALDERIRAALLLVLAWLAERQLGGYLDPLLRMFQRYFTPKELAAARRRSEEIAAEHARKRAAAETDARLRVTMLGTIEVRTPGEEPTRLRGARLKTMLGLLVLDRMLEKPLSYREFVRLAASGEEDPERARKVMNMGVLRLREVVGNEAILTDRETPRLNLERVNVDLLEAHELLRAAADAARAGTLVKAFPPLMRALRLSRGEVPFPSLYDTFFEAAREDFEVELRTASVDVGRGLLREGDAANAEEMLRLAFDAMPGDEEIAELLQEALLELGKRAEAARVRLQRMEGDE